MDDDHADASVPLAAPGASPGDCPIVGVGASAGGLEAYQRLLAGLPADTGLAFVLVQHLAPGRISMLAKLLSQHASMPVCDIEDGVRVEPDRVYVIPPGKLLTINEGRLRLADPAGPQDHHAVIDLFFKSLAEDAGEKAIAVVLSGAGSDGTLGVRAIKERGGLALAEEPARFDSMPRNAAASGLVDYVLPVEQMPDRLVDHARYLAKIGRDSRELDKSIGESLMKLCAVLRTKLGHDFSLYKENTMIRRIQRRMQVLQIDDANDYLTHLRTQPGEADKLFQEILIGVTCFFRDPEAFESLNKEVVPALFDDRAADSQIRVWVAGCASGEEAYSIAMLLREQAETFARPPKIQVFATDLDDQSINAARAGFYPAAIARDVSAERLERFFSKDGNLYRLKKEIREMCIFSVHNLINDPPFSRLDLISCRNVLIYLRPDLQRRLIPLFHYALRPGGCLFLGPSEGVSQQPGLFDTIDKKHRLFRRREVASVAVEFPIRGNDVSADKPLGSIHALPLAERATLPEIAQRRVLAEFAPAHVLITESHEILYFSQRTGKYLEPATGLPSTNLLSMARPGLRMDLRSAVHRAVATHQRVTQENVSVALEDGFQLIDLVVEPCQSARAGENLYLVVFNDVGPIKREDIRSKGPRAPAEASVEHLENELRAMSERLQTTIEELETANEELKSSNEELISMNEELQSSNEELETSKEELQSLNEELITVNSQLTAKVEELDRVNNDLKNLLESTQITTIFLDTNLRIKSFTAGTTALFPFLDSDQGRPFTDIVGRLAEKDVEQDCRGVLKSLMPMEREVHLAQEDATYIMRILPYRTFDNIIEGVVITFFDVTAQQHAQNRILELGATLRDRVTELEALLDVVPVGIAISHDLNCSQIRLNRRAAEIMKTAALIGPPGAGYRVVQNDRELAAHELPMQMAARTGRAIRDFDARIVHQDDTFTDVTLTARPLFHADGTPRGAVCAFMDISDRQRVERHKELLLHELQHRVKNTLATVTALITEARNRATSVPDLVDSITGRLLALAKAHDILARSEWEGADLGELVRIQLQPYAANNMSVSGPPVRLTSEAAMPLAMCIHELTTNAAKYGALSAADGSVTVTWVVERGSPSDVLALEWTERGGPPIVAEPGKGFGRQIIESGLAYALHAQVRFAFPESGAQCSIRIPLADLVID